LPPGRRIRALLVALLALAAASALASSASAAALREKGREPFFPNTGSRAYDAQNYRVRLAWTRDQSIAAVTAMRARARSDLREFSLDYRGPAISAIKVDGGGASWSRRGGKLEVRPGFTIKQGDRFKVTVAYAGKPPTIVDSDGSSEGWYPTEDGALAVGEPQGTAAWIPCNNIPSDKASFEITLIVPKGLAAMSNGLLTSISDLPGRTVYNWEEPNPMSTYLAVADIGTGEIERGTLAGKPNWTLVDPSQVKKSRRALSQLGRIIHFESSIYGPYPFSAVGSIVDDAPGLGYALETQSRPIYPEAPDLTTVVHETAHQWFGDSVGLKRWPNIWLNEGFATWTEWFYAENHGGRTASAIFHKLHRVPASNTDFWEPPSGHPGQSKNLFATSTYVRGAMTLQVLREKIGTRDMVQTLRLWTQGHHHSSADIGEFEELAERVSGDELGPLFQKWLYKKGKP
jgi:aminopeptidase N